MAQDQLTAVHLARLLMLCQKAKLEDHRIDAAAEFLARRQAGLPDDIEEPKTGLCETCFHAPMCVVFNMMPQQLEVKVGSCQGYMPVPSDAPEISEEPTNG